MSALQFVMGIFLWLLPTKILQAIFVANKQPKPVFYFSGRVALKKIGEHLSDHRNTIIIPEYICNVVGRAFLFSKYNIITYKCNENFELNLNEIKMLGSQKPGSILLLAPIAGAECGQAWITSEEGRNWRKENDLFLIFDFCQDFSRMYSDDFCGEVNFALLSSFNNKSFAGVMGAVIFSDAICVHPKKARFIDCQIVWKALFFNFLSLFRFYLLHQYVKKNATNLVGSSLKVFDYSYCTDPLYSFNHEGIVKIQLSIGAVGKLMLGKYRKKKLSYIKQKLLIPLSSPYCLTSCFIRTKSGGEVFKIKLPYALDGEPKKSLRPDANLIHFKGFKDFQ
jgi:hypothetical protein